MQQNITHGFTGKIWNNGQFGIAKVKTLSSSFSKPKLVGQESSRWERSVAVHGVQATLDFVKGSDEYFCSDRGMLPVPDGGKLPGNAVRPIGSSLLPKRHKRGMLGITTHGQKVVRNACKALQDRYGRSRLSFLTLTVPGMSKENLGRISGDWSRIVKVFIQKLKRSLQDRGLSGEIVGVTEVQPARFEKRGEFALHLHLLFQGAVKSWQWAHSPHEYREMWLSVLESVVARSEWSYADSVENVRAVKHSAEGYLGKYMSKGHKNLLCVREQMPDVSLPSAWWHCTYKLRRHVLSSVCHVSGSSAQYLLELIETCPDLFDYLKPVRVRMGERDIGVGYCGRIAPDRVVEIRSILYALKRDRYVKLGMVEDV